MSDDEEELSRRGTHSADEPLSESELASAEFRAEDYDWLDELFFSGDWELDAVNPLSLEELLFGQVTPESIAVRIRVLNGFNLLPRLLREVRAARVSQGGMTAEQASVARSRRIAEALREPKMRIVK